MKVKIHQTRIDYELLAKIRRAKMIEEGFIKEANNINWELYAKILKAKAEQIKNE